MSRAVPSPGARRGATLLDVALVCALVAVLAAIAFPRTAAMLDRIQVRAAVDELMAACAAARHLAILRGQPATVTVDDAAGTVVVTVSADTVVRRELASTFGITLAATRGTLTYASTGLGFGVSNLQVVVTRGQATDTVLVSRLGRVRR